MNEKIKNSMSSSSVNVPLYRPEQGSFYSLKRIPEGIGLKGRQALQEADSIHIILDQKGYSKLGDLIVSTACIFGTLASVKRPIPVNLYVEQQFVQLLQPFEQHPQISQVHTLPLLPAPISSSRVELSSHDPFLQVIKPIIETSANPFILDMFAMTHAHINHQKINNRDFWYAEGLFHASIANYPSHVYGPDRFSLASDDFYGATQGNSTATNAQPYLFLPEGYAGIREALINVYQIDSQRPHTAIIPEVALKHRFYKEYPDTKWLRIITELVHHEPNRQFSIITQDASSGLEKLVKKNMVNYAKNIRFVNNITLEQLMVFGSLVDNFISADTGPSHLLLALPHQPWGITLHSTQYKGLHPDNWRSSYDRQYQISANHAKDISHSAVLDTFNKTIRTRSIQH